jgi:hypothetical protein
MTGLVSNIKGLLQANQSIGKIDSPVPLLISNTLEILVADLLYSSLSLIKKLGKKRIKTKHLKYIIKKKTRFRKFEKRKC